MDHIERKERRQEMAEYVKAGKSIADAVKRFNVSGWTVRNACSENGVIIPNSYKEKRKKAEQAALMVSNGSTNGEAAKALELSRQQVYHACQRFGVEVRHRLAMPTMQAIALLFDPDLSYADIAQRMDIGEARVHQIAQAARKAGIPYPPRTHYTKRKGAK